MNLNVNNHLRAEAYEAWLALIMGGCFHNSGRCDLPTRVLRVYFTSFDSYELSDGATDQGHIVNLAGFDNERGTNQGWNRFTYNFMTGFQIRDLKSFIWRAEHRSHHFEIHARRIDNSRWVVEYISDCINSEHNLEMVEYDSLLQDWFRMIDPNTFEIVKAETLVSLASAAGTVASSADSRTKRGYHPQMFRQLQAFAAAKGLDVNHCLGARYITSGAPRRAELLPYWRMLLELPIEEDRPTFRVGFYVEHKWNLRHVDILFVRYGEKLPENFHSQSRTATEQEIIDELIVIGRAIEKALGKPPEFSFRPYMKWVNWHPSTGDKTRIDRVLAEATAKLGWTMF